MNVQFPLKYFRDNLIFNVNGEVYAVYELQGFTYDYKGTESKFELLNNVSRLIANLGTEGKIFVYPIAKSTEMQFETLREKAKHDVLGKQAVKYFNDVEGYIEEKTKENGNINDYQFFLTVKLKNVVLEKTLKDMAMDIPRTINAALNIANNYILKEEYELYKRASKNILHNLSANLFMVEATPEQVQWMLTRMMSRGTGKDIYLRENINGEPWYPTSEKNEAGNKASFAPNASELLTLFEGQVTHEKKYITVETDDGTSIQTFLSFSHIPDGIAFPGMEFLKILYDFPIAFELCITYKSLEYKEAITKVSRQSKKIQGQMLHTVESGERLPDDLLESGNAADALIAELSENAEPLIETTISMCISGTDREQIDKDVATIRNFYRDWQFRVERPIQDQLMNFYQFIPGSPIYESDYKMQLTPKLLAGSMFLAARKLGDNVGSYIGTIGMVDKPVYFTPFLAPLMQRSAACYFMGTLGGGKSFNSNLITYTTIMQGARALIIDPKSERGKWKEELPELRDHITITTLTSKAEDKGKLDPFNIYKNNRKEAGELARNILIELYKIESKSPTDVILAEVINKVAKAKQPVGMEHIYKLLQRVPDKDENGNDNTVYQNAARALARLMRATKELGMASLLFGTGKEQGLSFDARVNILQIDGLNMPEPTLAKEEYNESQTLSTVLMIPISSFAKKFANAKDPKTGNPFAKTILLDESWALRQTNEGKNLFNYLARAGRSLNCCTIFIGHSVKDVDDEGLKAAITFKFCFKVNTRDEAIASLKFMELEPTKSNVETLMRMPNGHALFKDLNGNVDVLRFDCVKPHIGFAFNTNPNKYKTA